MMIECTHLPHRINHSAVLCDVEDDRDDVLLARVGAKLGSACIEHVVLVRVLAYAGKHSVACDE